MTTFSTNLRRLRLAENGRWTLLSAADQKKAIHLCDYCTLNAACLAARRVRQVRDDHPVAAVIADCAGYRPAVSFRDDRGLDARFNTVRIGRAWAERVKKGAFVTLWHGPGEEPIGTARVLGSKAGVYREVAPLHARFNHTQLGLDPEGAEARLLKVLVASYGSTFMTAERQVSVIYMERCDDAPQEGPHH
ncbi:hypothetical protein [Azospirillum argentinense]|uniref:hypothetical protein n=1 Tax=Azospirillum argentinense TaxID=2970906 RepID=UPI0032DF3E39